MEGQPQIPFEARREPFPEGAVCVETGHLVLVLVRHQLVRVAGDRAAERFAVPERPFRLAHPLDELLVP